MTQLRYVVQTRGIILHPPSLLPHPKKNIETFGVQRPLVGSSSKAGRRIRVDRLKEGLSAAWRSGLERRYYDDHHCKVKNSTPNPVSLLRSWIRGFMMIISAWWNLATSKLQGSEKKFNRKTGKQRQLPSESEYVLRVAPPPLSHDRRIKMKKIKSINQIKSFYGNF